MHTAGALVSSEIDGIAGEEALHSTQLFQPPSRKNVRIPQENTHVVVPLALLVYGLPPFTPLVSHILHDRVYVNPLPLAASRGCLRHEVRASP